MTRDHNKQFVVLRFRDLMAWINSMMALVSSDELAKDVTGAEALLERHQVPTGLPRKGLSYIQS